MWSASRRAFRLRHGTGRAGGDDRPVRERWAARPRLRPGSPAWRYLADERCIPPEILAAAARLDAVREGHRGSAWFAHRRRGEVCHVEERGPDCKGSLAGGTKTLFPFGTCGPATWRTVVTEAPIDALILAPTRRRDRVSHQPNTFQVLLRRARDSR